MRKEMYLIRAVGEEGYPEFTRRVLHSAEQLCSEEHIRGVKVCLTTGSPPVVHVIPFSRRKIASLSLWKEDQEEDKEEGEGVIAGYVVEEALPVAYDKEWKDGERTPGAGLLTLFRKKPGLDYATFLRKWHESHTPISLRVHPLWNYSRNVVLDTAPGWGGAQRAGDPGAPGREDSPWFDAIVEEQVRERSHLINPCIFFGSPLTMLWNMGLVLFDSRSFIDYSSMETYLVDEYILKSD
jgi:hypothetical protein